MTSAATVPVLQLQECCSPITHAELNRSQAVQLADSFKALADPARVQLLSVIAAQDEHEACVCDLTEPLGLSQPTVSHHLRILTKAGFLSRSQRGTWAHYRIVPGALEALSTFLRSV